MTGEDKQAPIRRLHEIRNTGDLGAFGGRPTSGHKIDIDEPSIFRIQDGRVAGQWCLNDDLAFGRQLRGEPVG